MSYKHLVYMSQPDFALLTRNAAGSRFVWVPLSPPATFPQSNFTHSSASAFNVEFSQHSKWLILTLIDSFISDFSNF